MGGRGVVDAILDVGTPLVAVGGRGVLDGIAGVGMNLVGDGGTGCGIIRVGGTVGEGIGVSVI